jgi:Ala-tRNA(Pro) deacylase
MDKYHPVAKQIVDLLEKEGCWYETFEHKAVETSEEAATLRTGYSLEQGAKALIMIVSGSEGRPDRTRMLVLPGDLKLKNKRVRKFFKTRSIRFASRKEANKITVNKENGFVPVEFGGVPPFGNLFGLEVIVDPKLLENEKIVFNAGDRRFSVGMKSADFVRLVKPVVVRIT